MIVRLTVHIGARTPTCQHAGARRQTGHQARPPAAEHFMPPGALHVFVRRQCGPSTER